jgi:hypothetical protein
MPSSTSSSEHGRLDAPAYDRPLPAISGVAAVSVALAVLLAGLAAWEWHWRDYGGVPAFRNSDGQWAIQRRRIDSGEGDKTVIIGASRMLFDVQLEVWERLAGERPIQLALEGTSPVPVLEDLADDPDFTGRLVVGVAPDVFFSGFEYREKAFAHYRSETPAQRAGEWLSMTFLEPWLAFYEPDFALFTILKRQQWPARRGVSVREDVRKLSVSERDRNTQMWHKLEVDPDYRAMAQRVWAQDFGELPPDALADARRTTARQIERAAKAVRRLRARGVQVVFVRPPSADRYLAYERRDYPRADTWDVLLARAGVPGIHFEDHPELQGYWLPEWSHMSAAEARRFTAALQPLVQQAFASYGKGD